MHFQKNYYYLISFLLVTTIDTKQIESNFVVALKNFAIIPEVIDICPLYELTVIFEDEKKLRIGAEKTEEQVRYMPEIQWKANPRHFYTLLLTTPDVPTRSKPIYREWLQWLVVNIPGTGIVRDGDTIAEYYGSSPPQYTGYHRYVFLLFAQQTNQTFDEPIITTADDTKRRNFSTKNFIDKYNLGIPIAANVYIAKFNYPHMQK